MPVPPFAARLDPTPLDIDGLRAAYNSHQFPEHILDGGDPKADNLARAGFAAKTVLAYADEYFGGASGEDFDTVIGDLLGDLLHLCDALDLDLDDLVAKGRYHYFPETIGEL